jgi:hypothetical protein
MQLDALPVMPSLLPALLLAATAMVPLNDLGSAPYHWGYFGGLWENGLNQPPADHAAGGLLTSEKIVPRDAEGRPDPDGEIAFLMVGGPLVDRIACGVPDEGTCSDESFIHRAQLDPRFRNDRVRFVNGASLNQDPTIWGSAKNAEYERIRSVRLAAENLTEKQVQVAWLILNNPRPYEPLPVQSGDAYTNKIYVAAALRAMKKRYPNLAITYISSSPYRGYAVGEPFGFEDGLTTRWVVVGQVETTRIGGIGPYWDSRIGDVSYTTGVAPWIAWGPYLWADGTNPRSDGLTWHREDFGSDGETPTRTGVAKAASLLIDFLLREPTARPWLDVAPAPPARRRPASH